MKWFGESWGAPICETVENCDTPVGVECFGCSQEIKLGDRGFEVPYLTDMADDAMIVYHLDCFLKELGTGESRCSKCGRTHPSIDTCPEIHWKHRIEQPKM